jgi:two-component system, OmpR family, sensor histidine kinase VicK
MKNVKKRMDLCYDHRAPSVVVEIPAYRNGYLDILKRGGEIRVVTEITKENLRYCKELMKLVTELRHLDGIKGGIAVNETEYMATTILQEAKPLTEVIYSNVREVVQQGQYIFDTFLEKAMPAARRIKEIEEGIVNYETRLIQVPEDILRETKQMINESTKYSVCSVSDGLLYAYNHAFEEFKDVMGKYRKGEHKGVRWVANIEGKEVVQVVKAFLDLGMQVKHIQNLLPMSFGVSDKEIGTTIDKLKGGKLNHNALFSNEPVYIEHFASIFEELWKNGIDARIRIREIEEGVERPFIEAISDHERVGKILVNLAKSARKEVLSVLPNDKSLIRMDRLGIVSDMIEASKKGVEVKVICPITEQNSELVKRIEKASSPSCIRIMNGNISQSGFVIVDSSQFLTAEIENPIAEETSQAIGSALYSNNIRFTNLFKSFFEALWKQAEMYHQLEVHNKMQTEFIDIAAHEIRTPIQPILGMAQVLQSHSDNNKSDLQDSIFLDIIIRNANRLNMLTENLLEVARIESNTMKLNKEKFDMNEKIRNVIRDVKHTTNGVQIVELLGIDPILVEADKVRIFEVISNLIGNAIKFTREGEITVKAEKVGENVLVQVKDTGTGIDSDIMPRLFEKFATKSDQGTGLGLFISKNIIEAHGGKIWAENNQDEKGATFSFTLPMA